MLLYEILIAITIGIAVVLFVAAIDRLAARVIMGPEEMALLRLARAATAQRRLVASAAQQEREARAAAAQRRLVAAAAQQEREARAAAAQRRLVAAAAQPPRGVLDARTRGTAPSASRYAHHSTRNTGRERSARRSSHRRKNGVVMTEMGQTRRAQPRRQIDRCPLCLQSRPN
jgi:hypothetical protein